MDTLPCFCCDHLNPAGARFCNDCGTPLNLKPCKQCEAINDRPAMHCYQCGAEFAFPFPESIPDVIPEALFAAAPACAPADDGAIPNGPIRDTALRGATTVGANRIPGAALMAGLVAVIALSAYYAYRPPLHRFSASGDDGEVVIGMTSPGRVSAALASKPQAAMESILRVRPADVVVPDTAPGAPEREVAVPPTNTKPTLARSAGASKSTTRHASRATASVRGKHAQSVSRTASSSRAPTKAKPAAPTLVRGTPAPSAPWVEPDSMIARAQAKPPADRVEFAPPPVSPPSREPVLRTPPILGMSPEYQCQEGAASTPACAIRTLQRGD